MSEGKFRIDRTGLPYDAFVADPSWLGPVEEEKPDVKCVLIHDHFQNAKAYKEVSPVIFEKAGPGCVTDICPEKRPCGHPRSRDDWDE